MNKMDGAFPFNLKYSERTKEEHSLSYLLPTGIEWNQFAAGQKHYRAVVLKVEYPD